MKSVTPGSSAAKAGFRAGDELRSLAGQPMLSIADVQWVLHNTDAKGDSLSALVSRDGVTKKLSWELSEGWRRQDDISWRVTSWPMRRMGLGGLVLEPTPAEKLKRLDLPEGKMALHVKGAGRYGPHATARKKGFREGDVLISFDGRDDLVRESDLLAYAVNEHKPGEVVPVKVWRNGKTLTFRLPMQE